MYNVKLSVFALKSYEIDTWYVQYAWKDVNRKLEP